MVFPSRAPGLPNGSQVLWCNIGYSLRSASHICNPLFSFCFYLAGNLCVLNSQWEDCKVQRVPIRGKKKTSEWVEPQNKQKKAFKVQNACSSCHFGNYVILFCILALMLFPVVLNRQGCGENHFEFRDSDISAKSFRLLLLRDGLTSPSCTGYTCFLLGTVCLCVM